MRDFRTIRKFEVDWKDAQREIEKGKQSLGNAAAIPPQPSIGGGVDLEALLDELADQS